MSTVKFRENPRLYLADWDPEDRCDVYLAVWAPEYRCDVYLDVWDPE